MENEKITAWVTKYALTEGIQKVEGEVCHSISSDMLSYGRYNAAHGKDWHRTPYAALNRAEDMRQAKIASVRKQLKKLESMVFELPN